MPNPLISIIIPNYNRANLIGETLESILAQTYTNWECIVVDDGSTDNSKEVIQKYVNKDTRFQLHDRPDDRPKGANACRNYGFELSKGEYVNWFDSDDIMLENFIKEKVVNFKNTIDMIICTGYITDNKLQNRIIISLYRKYDLFKDYSFGNIPVMTPSVLFRKTFLDQKELFLDDITIGQESEFFSRIFFKMDISKYAIIDKPLYLYRHHSGTKSRKNQTYINKNKESQSYLQIENLKRSIQLKDSELFNVFYSNLIHYIYLSIENKHLNNTKYILGNMIKILWNSDKKKFLNFILFDIFYHGIKRYGSIIKRKFVKNIL